MTKSAKKVPISVQTEMKVTVTPAPFRPSTNLKFLDFSKLRSRRSRLELGEFVGSCCPTKLYAIIERGVVVRVELEKPKGSTAPPPFLERALVDAIKLLKGRAPEFVPTPVDEFVRTMQKDAAPGGPSGDTICFFIDWEIPFYRRVVFGCCVTYHKDSSGKITVDRLWCGDPMASQF